MKLAGYNGGSTGDDGGTVEKASAAHVDGVLTITLPKKAAPKPKSIAIAGIQKAAEDDKDEDGVMV